LKWKLLFAISIFWALGSGCASPNLAPQAPDKPWQPEKASQPTGTPAGTTSLKFVVPADPALPYERGEVHVDSAHPYTLPELIDLAERSSPDTRIAWEQSRQAAFSVGLEEAAYLPKVTAEVLGGLEHLPTPIPDNVDPRGYFNLNAKEILPSLVIKWLLFDFGKRKGKIEAAKQTSVAANVAFTGAHQKLIFDVAKAYFALDADRAQLHVAEEALKTSKTLQEASEAKKKRGLETQTEVAMARRGTAKAQFDLEKSRAAANDAYHALLEAMGLTPTIRLQIDESAGRTLPKGLADEVRSYIDRALVRRPDIVASLAKLRASDGEITAAKAEYYPTIGVEGLVSQNIGSLNIDNGPNYRVNEPSASILMKISFPLYDGGVRKDKLEIERSKNAQAQQELSKVQDEAVRQVAKTYDAVKSALAEYQSALALVEASNLSYSSALGSYQGGVGTFTDAVSTETDKVQALSAQAQAYASVLTAAAALAFSTGELTSTEALNSAP